ncbi:PQQ-binding-like beta-propeller repeat protein [Desulfobacterales bacterium HSG17]|nr:PQQ-binding-like beta-propeller repeat protein [Desulfobacterales bacterium HSG17]
MHCDNRHTGQALVEGPKNVPNIIFSYHIDEPFASDPIIDKNNSVYICGNNNLYAIDSTGNLLWQYPILEGVTGTPCLSSTENAIFVPSNNGIYSLTLDGTFNWKLSLPSDAGHIEYKNNDIYFVCAKYLYSVNKDGIINWNIKPDYISSVYSTPSLTSQGKIIIPAYIQYDFIRTYYLLCYGSDGTLLWEKELSTGNITPVTISSTDIIYCGYSVFSGAMGWGHLFAFDDEGNTIWVNGWSPRGTYSALYNDEIIIAGGYWGSMSTFNALTGDKFFLHDITNSISPIFDSKGKIYTTDIYTLHCLGLDGETIWTYPLNPATQCAIGSNKRLYIGSKSDDLYCLGD